jgi:hypothetical protein
VTFKRAVPNVNSERPAETRGFFVGLLGFEVPSVQVTIVGNDDMAAPGISVEVDDVDAVHAGGRFMLREPSGTIVNVLSHRSGRAPGP